MVIPQEVRDKYGVYDADTALFLDSFDLEPNSKVLVVGAHDEASANMLAECGFDVTGVDLREYDKSLPPCNYNYVRCDFCNMPDWFIASNLSRYDALIGLSCIEHFGLNTYEEGKSHQLYDVIALRWAWHFLRMGGKVFLTVPFGRMHIDYFTHWRVYSPDSLVVRLVQDFQVNKIRCVISGPILIGGVLRDVGSPITEEEARSYVGEPPHISVLVEMTKVPISRLAPNGG